MLSFSRRISDCANNNNKLQLPPLQYLEESMSMLGISGNHSTEESEVKRSPRGRLRSNSMDANNDALRGVNRRTIVRPQKYKSPSDSEPPNIKAIQKIYMRKTLGRVKVTNLETIFEDVADDAANVNEEIMNNSPTAFGLRKLKRQLTFRPTKALKEKRKKRVLSIFGRGKRFKRVSMQYFVDHLNALNSTHNPDDSIEAVVDSIQNNNTNSIPENGRQNE